MATDFTKGKITPELIRFTVPLVLGNLFQLLYNAVDSMIVGRYVGKEALAAVGTSNPLMTLVILFINGITLGAGILIGAHYGARDYDTLRRQISTTMLGGLGFTAAVSLIFVVLARPIFTLMQVDPSILDLSVSYMRIIFCGLVFTFIYNCLASILRALGDSTGPLVFLVVSSVLNVIGDLLLVVWLRMGSNGAAISTVVCEAISCVLCLIYLQKRVPLLRLGKGWLVFDKSLFGATVAYGWTSAMQQATVQLGKICIQSIVNTMGVSVMAAFTIVNRMDDFAMVPQQNIGHAMTSFMAINRGAKKPERVKEGFRKGMGIELAYGLIIFLICFIFARPIVGLSTQDPLVIEHGVKYLHLISFMYFLPAVTNGVQGFFRGMGDLRITLISSMTNMGVRVAAALILVFLMHLEMEALPLSYLAGWIGMLLVELPLLRRTLSSGEMALGDGA
ncbi:MAG: MATE family efflux transporter [Clostridia bacterium]|nr:MATE family efflux transporter [Clostridia bacterium]